MDFDAPGLLLGLLVALPAAFFAGLGRFTF